MFVIAMINGAATIHPYIIIPAQAGIHKKAKIILPKKLTFFKAFVSQMLFGPACAGMTMKKRNGTSVVCYISLIESQYLRQRKGGTDL